jgi:uncharacterized membrane protein
MSKAAHTTLTCHVCGKSFPERSVRPFSLVRPGVSRIIEAGHPGWGEGKVICIADLATARRAYVEELLEEERGELGVLEQQVLDAMSRDVMITQNPENAAEERMTRGERIADRVAEVGGSWSFIIGFGICLLVWMGINVLSVFQEPFDPYPFILLNLMLSTLAALQAPVIMMSQRRQEQKDRLRAENDYRVNLKAELEIRQLHEKIDHQLAHQWERLTELQQLQIDLLEDRLRDRDGR